MKWRTIFRIIGGTFRDPLQVLLIKFAPSFTWGRKSSSHRCQFLAFGLRVSILFPSWPTSRPQLFPFSKKPTSSRSSPAERRMDYDFWRQDSELSKALCATRPGSVAGGSSFSQPQQSYRLPSPPGDPRLWLLSITLRMGETQRAMKVILAWSMTIKQNRTNLPRPIAQYIMISGGRIRSYTRHCVRNSWNLSMIARRPLSLNRITP
ncbi:hypothetical protein BDR06DRAFT_719500 [Suillus hirtellus]|nr:hypothetical protein BDR06DRAFT_719500 [Suillus hirtellus]